MKTITPLFFILSITLFTSCGTANTSDSSTSKHAAEKWEKRGDWRQGLTMAPHKSIDAVEFARQYNGNKKYWDEAFDFLRSHDLKALENKKYPIDGDNVFATVTENPTKPYEQTQWESHRKYIDLQYVISGSEKMGKNPVSASTVTNPYNEAKDVANYKGEGKIYTATPEAFFLFFPGEAHRPNITTGGNLPDKKIVIKIRSL